MACVKAAGLDSQDGMCALLKEELCGDIFCVHRLDREVGGLMVYARSSAAAAALSAAIAGRKMEKEYLAVISGRPEEPEGLLKDLLYRDAAKNKSYVVRRMRRGVREAELEYRLLESCRENSLIAVKLHTGRSHQRRVQFASRGLPLRGDTKYGSRERGCSIALFSYRLAFSHPKNGEKMAFFALPEKCFPWNQFRFFEDQ